MAVMTIEASLDMIIFILILISILLIFLIILRTAKKICKSHKLLFAGFIVFMILKILKILTDFQMIELSSVYFLALETVFILLFILGFWEMYQGIEEVIHNKKNKTGAKRKIIK